MTSPSSGGYQSVQLDDGGQQVRKTIIKFRLPGVAGASGPPCNPSTGDDTLMVSDCIRASCPCVTFNC